MHSQVTCLVHPTLTSHSGLAMLVDVGIKGLAELIVLTHVLQLVFSESKGHICLADSDHALLLLHAKRFSCLLCLIISCHFEGHFDIIADHFLERIHDRVYVHFWLLFFKDCLRADLSLAILVSLVQLSIILFLLHFLDDALILAKVDHSDKHLHS